MQPPAPRRSAGSRRAARLRERMAALMDAVTLVNSTLELDVVLERIMSLAMRLTQAEASSILLTTASSDELTFHTQLGGADPGQLRQVRVPMDRSLAGWVVKNDRPLRIDDAAADERFFREADRTTHFQTRSVLAVPVKERDRVIGTVQVLNKSGGAVFDEEDEDILVAMAGHVGTAIHNSRTYQDLLDEKRALEAIVGSLADGIVVTGPDGELRQLNEAARRMFGLVEGQERSVLLEVFLAGLPGLGATTSDVVLLKPRGRVLSVRVTPFNSARGTSQGLVAALRDVTETRVGQRRRDEVFAAGLHSLLHCVEGLQASPPGGTPDARLERLHQDARTLTWFSDIEMGPVRLLRRLSVMEETVRSATETWSSAAGIAVELEVARDLPDVYVDTKQLTRALELTLAACARLLSAGGRLRVALALEGKSVITRLEGESDSVELASIASLLEERQQVDQFLSIAGGQIDLSLAYARHILDSHGATLDFERSAGTFRFRFAVPSWREAS
ncbi:MAG: GAF domain-containing protein [Candidatus Wallbacteria bacterium]|nr:GAF domain-containing protein [Candidatus Wallbacteria bacterium]